MPGAEKRCEASLSKSRAPRRAEREARAAAARVGVPPVARREHVGEVRRGPRVRAVVHVVALGVRGQQPAVGRVDDGVDPAELERVAPQLLGVEPRPPRRPVRARWFVEVALLEPAPRDHLLRAVGAALRKLAAPLEELEQGQEDAAERAVAGEVPPGAVERAPRRRRGAHAVAPGSVEDEAVRRRLEGAAQLAEGLGDCEARRGDGDGEHGDGAEQPMTLCHREDTPR